MVDGFDDIFTFFIICTIIHLLGNEKKVIKNCHGIKKRDINVGKLRVMIIFVGSFQGIIYGTIQYREALQQAS